MIWSRLKKMRCPQCDDDLKNRDTFQYKCVGCGFTINKSKFDHIVDMMYKGTAKFRYDKNYQEDNQEELNNL